MEAQTAYQRSKADQHELYRDSQRKRHHEERDDNDQRLVEQIDPEGRPVAVTQDGVAVAPIGPCQSQQGQDPGPSTNC